jgi:hypothetical protein
MSDRTCYVCGASLTGCHHSRRFCSDACRRAALLKRNVGIAAKRLARRREPLKCYACEQCQRIFQATREAQRYCSSACRQAAYREHKQP